VRRRRPVVGKWWLSAKALRALLVRFLRAKADLIPCRLLDLRLGIKHKLVVCMYLTETDDNILYGLLDSSYTK
jgi:hypothetical protein